MTENAFHYDKNAAALAIAFFEHALVHVKGEWAFQAFRLQPWQRRLVTRAVAIVPAAAITLMQGESELSKLLIFTQVVLSLQLPFAVVPLVHLTASRAKLGALVAPLWMSISAALVALLIIGLNFKLLADLATGNSP